MIDFHCHLDLYPNPHEVVARCNDEGLFVLSVTTVPSAFEGTLALAPAGGRIRTAIGLHPELAASRAHELALFERHLSRTRYVGEVGLDASSVHSASLDTQIGVFAEILRLCAAAGGKVLSVHSRGATGTVLDALEAAPTAGISVLHWYLGTKNQIARAVEMGCWFSVGPSMLASPRGRAAAAVMPKSRVVPESDGPFGTIAGRTGMPWDAWSAVQELASVWKMEDKEAALLVMSNFRSLANLGKVLS